MIVVADSSPVILLVNIGHIAILPRLFGQVIVPREVSLELSRPERPPAVRGFVESAPPWLVERSPAQVEPIPRLHSGELAAISLARELRADLLLIDEVLGRRAASERGIALTGTIGVLEYAADRGLLDLRNAFDRVKATDFWISHGLLDERLRIHGKRNPRLGAE